jgi:hypothetical protein
LEPAEPLSFEWQALGSLPTLGVAQECIPRPEVQIAKDMVIDSRLFVSKRDPETEGKIFCGMP